MYLLEYLNASKKQVYVKGSSWNYFKNSQFVKDYHVIGGRHTHCTACRAGKYANYSTGRSTLSLGGGKTSLWVHWIVPHGFSRSLLIASILSSYPPIKPCLLILDSESVVSVSTRNEFGAILRSLYMRYLGRVVQDDSEVKPCVTKILGKGANSGKVCPEEEIWEKAWKQMHPTSSYLTSCVWMHLLCVLFLWFGSQATFIQIGFQHTRFLKIPYFLKFF